VDARARARGRPGGARDPHARAPGRLRAGDGADARARPARHPVRARAALRRREEVRDRRPPPPGARDRGGRRVDALARGGADGGVPRRRARDRGPRDRGRAAEGAPRAGAGAGLVL
ncbi:MAG: hypothetical protein AVDCRST_MAG11-1148, partial [uncultured Gemmatimonadaceae bacterium]